MTRVTLGRLRDIADEEGDALCIPIDSSLLLGSTALSKRLRELGGEDLEEEVYNINKMLDEKQVDRDSLDGLIIPISSRNLRQFKGITDNNQGDI